MFWALLYVLGCLILLFFILIVYFMVNYFILYMFKIIKRKNK